MSDNALTVHEPKLKVCSVAMEIFLIYLKMLPDESMGNLSMLVWCRLLFFFSFFPLSLCSGRTNFSFNMIGGLDCICGEA